MMYNKLNIRTIFQIVHLLVLYFNMSIKLKGIKKVFMWKLRKHILNVDAKYNINLHMTAHVLSMKYKL